MDLSGEEELLRVFPGLKQSLQLTSPADPRYNCVAWAAGDQEHWWWPLRQGFWPKDIPRAETLQAFRMAFETKGFKSTSDYECREGVEKIAIFVNDSGKPTHAARQLPDGKWTSKLGKSYDISHDLKSVEGQVYGKVALVMQRELKI